MPKYVAYFWKQAPFVRLLIPFIAGIIIQWYVQVTLISLLIPAVLIAVVLISFFFVPIKIKYSVAWIQGLALQLIFLFAGAIVCYNSNITHNNKWIGKYYQDEQAVLATIKEPIVEKTKSFKAIAAVDAIQIDGEWKEMAGRILIYFRKDEIPPDVKYGSQILFTQTLQEIKNSGNPGAFDYKRYNAFQDIYHQVFLKPTDYKKTGSFKANPVWATLFNTRRKVIETLRKFIQPQREAAVAEALLIGYRDDLDKDLVQAYSNTGVVHIIAISGLHLGLIYGMLIGFFQPFKKRKWVRWLKPISIIIVLWTFTLIAGAAPSILRSAVMFTALVLGDVIDRKTSVYNNLAASAFLMLCYNPFFLWDVGFQLSYAALFSIVTFRDHIYKLIYIENKALDRFWRLNAVTISAQILTLPFILYHFHQFPNFFVITNLVAVPLSGFILYGLLGLLTVSSIPVLATWVGKLCAAMLWTLNYFVEAINFLPFSVTDSIQLNFAQAFLLAVVIVAISYWLIERSKNSFYLALITSIILMITFGVERYHQNRQQKIIVYNLPKQTQIDFIDAGHYQFIGDTSLLTDNFSQSFHLKPSRTLYQVKPSFISGLYISYPFTLFKNKRLLLIDKPYKFNAPHKIPVDVIIISKNPKIYISHLLKTFKCKQFVFDSSNPQWKINLWKKDCDSLHLRHHSTAEKGAFVMDL